MDGNIIEYLSLFDIRCGRLARQASQFDVYYLHQVVHGQMRNCKKNVDNHSIDRIIVPVDHICSENANVEFH